MEGGIKQEEKIFEEKLSIYIFSRSAYIDPKTTT